MKNIYIRIRTEEQLKETGSVLGRYPELASEIYVLVPVHMDKTQITVLQKCGVHLYADLPFIFRENLVDRLRSDIDAAVWAEGMILKNTDEMGLAKSIDYGGILIGDSFLYAYNSEAVKFCREHFPEMKFITSDELTDEELEKLPGKDGMIYKAYGRTRVMLTAQSMAANYNEAGCITIESAKHDRFIVLDEEYDQTAVYTHRPVSMLDKLPDLRWDNVMADLTAEDRNETGHILEILLGGLNRNLNSADAEKTACPAACKTPETGEDGSGRKPYRGHHFRGID